MDFNDRQFKLNSPEMAKIMQDVYLPTLAAETWDNSGALSEAFGLMKIGKKVNAATGKLDVYIKKGKHGAVGAFGDDYSFDHASQKPLGDEMVVRTRGFQANARIDIVPNRRMEAGGIENIFANQFSELGEALKKNYARMLYGDGSGVITTVAAEVTGLTAVGHIDVEVADIRSFEIGDLVTIPTKDGAAAISTPAIASPEAQLAGETDYAKATQTVTHKNAWPTHGAGNVEGGTTYMVVDIDEIESKISLGLEDMGKKFDPNGLVIAKDAPIYYRRSVDQDMHGLKYIMGIQGAGTSFTQGHGYFGFGEANYGKADGGAESRPKYMKPYFANLTSQNYLTEYDFMKAIELQKLRGADLTMNMVVTSSATRASIASTNQGASTGILRLTRNANATAANDQRSMGYQGVDLRGEAVEVDRFAPTGDVNFLDLSGFEFALEQDLTLDNFDGQTWKQVMLTKDTASAGTHKASRVLAYEANMYAYKNFFNFKPRTLAQIKLGTPKYIKPSIDASSLEATSPKYN